MDNTDALTQAPLFAGLSGQEIAVLNACAVGKSYSAHALLVQEGGQSDAFYVILTGKVKVYVSDDQGGEVILAFLGPGEVFGEMAFIDDGPRSASVMTVEPSRLLSISKTAFRDCLAKHPGLALNVIKTLASRVRGLNENVKSLALLDVYGRVARLLLKMATPRGDRLMIEQRLTHQDIASMVGSSREMVSRIMKDLERGGYLSSEDKHIVIKEKLPQGY